MTTENQDRISEAAAADAQSFLTEQRQVRPVHEEPGMNWAGIVVGVLAVIVFGILGFMFITAIGGEDEGAVPDEVNVNVDPGDGTDESAPSGDGSDAAG